MRGIIEQQIQYSRIEQYLQNIEYAIHRIEQTLNRIHEEGHYTMATLADIQAAVAAETEVENSVVILLNQISQQLKDAIASNDPAAMQAVVDQLDKNRQSLADAVSANTPAAPTA